MSPVSFERMPAEKYLELSQKQKLNIKDINILPPSFEGLDDVDFADFGSIFIEYKTPVYKMLSR